MFIYHHLVNEIEYEDNALERVSSFLQLLLDYLFDLFQYKVDPLKYHFSFLLKSLLIKIKFDLHSLVKDHKALEKRKVLENINASTKEREEYLLYLDNLSKKIIDTLKSE